jgi:hypothetical protein
MQGLYRAEGGAGESAGAASYLKKSDRAREDCDTVGLVVPVLSGTKAQDATFAGLPLALL